MSSKELLTIIEAEEIGKYRTAAVTALAVNKLRKPFMKNLSIIGTGFQARQQLNSILLRENRMQLAEGCFKFIEHRVNLDLCGWSDFDIFKH